jgi:hypothetical protein
MDTSPALVAGAVALGIGLVGKVAPARYVGARPIFRDTITFTRDVAPILYRHCAVCHRPGGSAHFGLLSYEEAAPRAALIADAMASGRMPPWLPEPGDVAFVGERRVPRTEIDVVRRWAEHGAPRGDVGHVPSLPPVPDEWQLGMPDLVVEFPAYSVPPSGPDHYRNLVATVPIGTQRWVSGVELLPGSPAVVHHARVMVDTTASSRQADVADADPGFDGMELGSDATNPPGFFVGWTPGKVPVRYSEGFAWSLAPGVDLVLQLHVRPAGSEHEVRPRLGLFFTGGPPRRPTALVMLGTKTIDIAPGDSAYVLTDAYELPVAVEALGVYPHAHYLATRMEAWAQFPDGRRRWLLRIPRWDFNWQDEYRYTSPLVLPKGTVLMMRYTYDNSLANPRNPSRPPRRVMFGSQSTDEMADLVVQVAPRRAGDVTALERDLDWKYYAEQVASDAYRAYARGRDLAAAGRLQEAVARFQESLSLRSDDPRVHHAMGAALAARGLAQDAVGHLEQAARLAPRDPEVLESLATAYWAAGEAERAAIAARQALALAEASSRQDVAARIRVLLERHPAK